MKVLLIYPRFHGDTCGSGSLHPPLGITYIAQVARDSGADVSILDLTFVESWDEASRQIKTYAPDLIGISYSTPLARHGLKTIELCKELYPDRLLVCGGPHSTIFAREIIKHGADVVVIGEGETTFRELLECFKEKKEFNVLQGIVFRDKSDEIVETKPQQFIKNLDELPRPALDLLNIPEYIRLTNRVTIITSRGCPGKCYYCQPLLEDLFGLKVRGNSPERIIEEVKRIKEAYYTDDNFLLEFVDDTFCYNRKRVKTFCDLYKKEKINIPFWVISRVDYFSEETAKALSDAGCLGISFGVESGSPRLLSEVMLKGTTPEKITSTFDICHKYNLLTVGFFMVGTPSETKEDFELTRKLIRRIHPDVVAVSITTPIPGSKLWRQSLENKYGFLHISNDTESLGCYYDNNVEDAQNKVDGMTCLQMKETLLKDCFWVQYRNLPKYLKIFFSSRGFLFLRLIKKALILRLKWLEGSNAFGRNQ